MGAERVWMVKDALDWTVGYLGRAGDKHPRRSAEWLLSAATGLSRVELYVHHDRPLTADERARYRELIERRAAGEPLQYVTGEMPFRHLVIVVEPGVFIPRPETEVLVDVALEVLADAIEPLICEVCTGSGCIAASLAFERPAATVWATDISERAVEAARRNTLHAGVTDRVQVVHGDLFEPLPHSLRGRVDLLVANPPYVPSADVRGLEAEVVGFEPHAALDGGPDGLDVVRRILDGAPAYLAPGAPVALEVDERRAEAAAAEFRVRDYEGVEVRTDLTGRDRIVVGRKGKAMQS